MKGKTMRAIATLACLGWAVPAGADIIHFKDGKTLEVPQVWEEGNDVVCERFGGVVRYPKSKVLKVEKAGAAPEAAPEPEKPAAMDAALDIPKAPPAPMDIESYIAKKMPPKNAIEGAGNATVTINAFVGTGSGFFVTQDGYILTNRHVVEGADTLLEKAGEIMRKERASLDQWKNVLKLQGKLEQSQEKVQAREAEYARKMKILDVVSKGGIILYLSDGTELRAPVVATSDKLDLALLKVEGHRTPTIAPSRASLAQGDPLFAIGNPLNLSHSVTAGIFSGIREGYLQTNIPLNPGNSGGPIITREGEVVGISTWKVAAAGVEGISFAIPIAMALQEFPQLRERFGPF